MITICYDLDGFKLYEGLHTIKIIINTTGVITYSAIRTAFPPGSFFTVEPIYLRCHKI